MKHNLFGDPVLQGFREHLIIHGKSINTMTSYITSVTKYIDWFSSQYGKAPSQLFAENVAEYGSWSLLVQEGKLAYDGK